MGRLDRASAAVANALRVLPAAGGPGDFATGPRWERMIERVHALGPRPLGGMLSEIAKAPGRPDIVADRLQAYAALDSELIRYLGGDRFPPMPLEVVR